MALPESDKLQFYAAWAASVGQGDLAVRLRESAVRVRRMECSLDELAGDAAEEELLAAAARMGGRREDDGRRGPS